MNANIAIAVSRRPVRRQRIDLALALAMLTKAVRAHTNSMRHAKPVDAGVR